jgi:hypothetical protein
VEKSGSVEIWIQYPTIPEPGEGSDPVYHWKVCARLSEQPLLSGL